MVRSCLEEIDAVDGLCVQADPGVSQRRVVRFNKLDATCGNFDSEQHRRRARSLEQEEYRQFLGIARSSNFELQTQIEIARALKNGHAKMLDEAEG